MFVHGNYLSLFERTLTEKYFLSSTVYSLDCFLCPDRGSWLINSLLVLIPKIMAICLFCPHLSLCQWVSSGGLSFLAVVDCSVVHRAAWSSCSCEILWFSSKAWAGLHELHGALTAPSCAVSEANLRAHLCPWVHTGVSAWVQRSVSVICSMVLFWAAALELS